ncbi:hypothetical protein D9756_007405 [Leucocoprinus leucothites]|uniref:Uncharacterized protein n=1 Tax=Leucocoprinus leucothites TaxID=201217 RepID=A0A8H5D419_9AGAR|nr:hypothetical protein D9756_007405 [Leucoagaricus leucothites]
MTVFDGAHVEWTASRITRLLRPLKSKCIAFSSYVKESSTGSVTTYGGRRLGGDQELLPLEIPSNIGLRIHFSQDMVQTFELSKRIGAIRDCYHDLLSKDKSIADKSTSSSVSSLTSICSVILGAQIPCEDETPENDVTPDSAEILYQAIPPTYRLRTLTMHALHIILESCPPNANLYLSLLNITLERQLYHESEVLLDATLDYAFESSPSRLPRVSNSAYRGFLADLYSNWNMRFSSSTFVRLVTGALQRSSSDSVWTSKATRRFARKLGRYDTNTLPTLLAGLSDTISARKKVLKPTCDLERQLREWFHFCAEICMSPIQVVSEGLISLQNLEMLDHILEHYRSYSLQMEVIGHKDDFLTYTFSDAIACLYSLWLTDASRQINQDDALHIQLQRYLPPSLTFAPLCSHLFHTKSLGECEEILVALSSILMNNSLPRLNASLWACALSHIEDLEIEQKHVDKQGRESVRDFRLWLVDCVDEAEKDWFVTPRRGIPSLPEGGGDSDQHFCSTSGWNWEASVGCWFRRDPRSQDNVPATPKRRRVSRHSHPSPLTRKPLPSADFFGYSPTNTTRYHSTIGNDDSCTSNRNHGDFDAPSRNTVDTIACKTPVPFSSLLSNALSSRANLRFEHQEPIRNSPGDSTNTASGESGESDLEIDSDVVTSHAPSEDHLDLFRIAGTSPVQVH